MTPRDCDNCGLPATSYYQDAHLCDTCFWEAVDDDAFEDDVDERAESHDCAACGGTGCDPLNDAFMPCDACDGTGVNPVYW